MEQVKINLHVLYVKSPIGLIKLSACDNYIRHVNFEDLKMGYEEPTPLLEQCALQLNEYFKGKRQVFDAPMIFHGTEFQELVWRTLHANVAYGTTCSYLELAKMSGRPKAVRAVGNANGQNPLTILIPCHRVIANDGSLGGYGGEVWRKEWLIQHEKKVLSQINAANSTVQN